MELRFSSVMLLLSCSLHQSLWGILASVPQTDAKKCKHKLSSKGETVKKVQMIRRIPARCSGWDEAWSWISKKDCHTKYVLDYVELPSAVQRVEEDCEEELSVPTPSSQFDITDEKFLAIAFGSATIALLIIVVIIVVSVLRRGSHRCNCCGGGPAYTSANVVDRDNLNEVRNCNVYEDNPPDGDHIYEEVFDKNKINKDGKQHSDMKTFKTVPGDDSTHTVSNGIHQRRPVTPTAPLEEEVVQTAGNAQANEYSVLQQTLVKSVEKQNNVSESHTYNDTYYKIHIVTDTDENAFDNLSRSNDETLDGNFKTSVDECIDECIDASLEQETLLSKDTNNLSMLERLGQSNATANVYSELESLMKNEKDEMCEPLADETVSAAAVKEIVNRANTSGSTNNSLSADYQFCNFVSHDKRHEVNFQIDGDDTANTNNEGGEMRVNALGSVNEINTRDTNLELCENVVDLGKNQSTCVHLVSDSNNVDLSDSSRIAQILPNDDVVLGIASEPEVEIDERKVPIDKDRATDHSFNQGTDMLESDNGFIDVNSERPNV